MLAGKCPKCEQVLSAVSIADITGNVNFQETWKCIAYSCPSCQTILSVQIDPIAIKTSLVAQIEALRKQK